jgi:hypothetical protein
MNKQARPPLPQQQQPMPGRTAAMRPRPDHGEKSYSGSGKLKGKKAVITGGDSGIGRAVAIAFAREGADLLISYQQCGASGDFHIDRRYLRRRVGAKLPRQHSRHVLSDQGCGAAYEAGQRHHQYRFYQCRHA